LIKQNQVPVNASVHRDLWATKNKKRKVEKRIPIRQHQCGWFWCSWVAPDASFDPIIKIIKKK
jgi:hypothetical protein